MVNCKCEDMKKRGKSKEKEKGRIVSHPCATDYGYDDCYDQLGVG